MVLKDVKYYTAELFLFIIGDLGIRILKQNISWLEKQLFLN